VVLMKRDASRKSYLIGRVLHVPLNPESAKLYQMINIIKYAHILSTWEYED